MLGPALVWSRRNASAVSFLSGAGGPTGMDKSIQNRSICLSFVPDTLRENVGRSNQLSSLNLLVLEAPYGLLSTSPRHRK